MNTARRSRQLAALAALAAVMLLMAAAFVSSPAAAEDDPALANAQARLAECQTLRQFDTRSSADRAWADTCIRLWTREVARLTPPSPTVVPTSMSPTTTQPPVTSVTPTSLPPPSTPPATSTPPPVGCPRTGHVPGGPDGFGGCWPDASSTGVPAGVTLTAYTGPCVITAPTTIDAKTVTCTLDIRSDGVAITRSRINGSVYLDRPGIGFVTITDSDIDCGGPTNSCLGKSDFIAMRLEIVGGNRSVWCEYNCTLQDSYAHGQAPDPSGQAHESGVRMGSGNGTTTGVQVIRHNAIACDAPEIGAAGCSADLTGYGDFAPIQNNLIERNLLMETTGGACAYGGSSGDDGTKPHGAEANNNVFRDNVFQRGVTPDQGGLFHCGFYFPITDFDSSRPGNIWSNNRWDSGEILPPAN